MLGGLGGWVGSRWHAPGLCRPATHLQRSIAQPLFPLLLPLIPADAAAANATAVPAAAADTPEVTTALLKFMSEFVLNKTQRLTFDSSSPNGILLFREVSRVIVTYGTRALQAGGPTSDPYGQV